MRAWYTTNTYWIAFAVYIAIATPVFWSFLSQHYQSVYDSYAAQHARAEAENKSYDECFAVSSVEKFRSCVSDVAKSAREPQRSEEDVSAQKEMALWAKWMLISTSALGLLTLSATIIGAVLLWRSLQDSRAHFIAENRPWLSLGEPIFSIHSDGGGSPVVFVKVAVKNVGKSPALNVYLHVKTDPMAMNFENSKAAERLAAEVAKPTAWRWGNVVIFPDGTEEITGVSDGVDNVPEKSRYLRVVICATCRGVDTDTVFHAASAYRFDVHILTEMEGEVFESVQATRIRGSNSIG